MEMYCSKDVFCCRIIRQSYHEAWDCQSHNGWRCNPGSIAAQEGGVLSCSLHAGRDRGRFPSRRPALCACDRRADGCSLPGCPSEWDRPKKQTNTRQMWPSASMSIICLFALHLERLAVISQWQKSSSN